MLDDAVVERHEQDQANRLTNEQRDQVRRLLIEMGPLSYSAIACKLGLTKSYVQAYVRHLNQHTDVQQQ